MNRNADWRNLAVFPRHSCYPREPKHFSGAGVALPLLGSTRTGVLFGSQALTGTAKSSSLSPAPQQGEQTGKEAGMNSNNFFPTPKTIGRYGNEKSHLLPASDGGVSPRALHLGSGSPLGKPLTSHPSLDAVTPDGDMCCFFLRKVSKWRCNNWNWNVQ